MGLDMWFREDVARILASSQETAAGLGSAVPALDPQTAAAYHRGFADALRAVAVAFGIAAPAGTAHARPWRAVDADILQPGLPSGLETRRNGGHRR
jgi:hypothetical protein